MRNLVYNTSGESSYGLWLCPDCGSGFFGGGEPLHRLKCPTRVGYEGIDYYFTIQEVAEAVERAFSYGDQRMAGACSPVSVALLLRHGHKDLLLSVRI